MDLLIDLGHTRLKWAWWQHGRVTGQGAVPWRGEEAQALCAALWPDAAAPRRVGLAAVAEGELRRALLAHVGQRWGMTPTILRAGARCGAVVNGYRRPEQLGVDRWAGLVGAWRRRSGTAALVVDCGSAVTVDALAADACHLGGIILPGLALQREAFYARTGRVPDADGVEHSDGCAADTASAVASGALLAVVGAIEAMMARTAERLHQPVLWLTGGDAPRVRPLLTGPVEWAPDLVFEGLAVMLEEAA